MSFPTYFQYMDCLDIVLHGLGLKEPRLDCDIVVSDVEANEHNGAQLLECGSVTINTTTLPKFEHGSSGASFLLEAEARHIRVIENAHIVNKKWCKGCPEAFEFGHTQFSTYSQLETFVKELLAPKGDEGQPRSVLYVAHDARKESETLRDLLGDNFETIMSNVRIVDTQGMASLLGYGKQIGLGKLLPHFGLSSANPHNAGNDALYTAGAMIGMAVKRYNSISAVERLSLEDFSWSCSEQSSTSSTSSTAPTDSTASCSPSNTSSISLQDALETLTHNAKQHPPAPVHGSYVYCTICASQEHEREACGYK